jgi:NAD(P)-dependent dehydrogenase (short-subunit alcohol dehydrogenase family)
MKTMLLANKIAIIYGAGGSVGSTIAETFAREGAKVFLTGRTKSKVDLVAEKINAAGGYAESAEVDALDEQAINEHLNKVIAKAGNIDVSFNAVGLRNTTLQGVPLVDLDVSQFMAPILSHVQSNFLTGRICRKAYGCNWLGRNHDSYLQSFSRGHPKHGRRSGGNGSRGSTDQEPVGRTWPPWR